ncbi:hypothetical protein F9K96_01080 [Brucella anthropi]|uniref:hypothetical protein n=1 Tax=Brucella anthropi TaxID=529 RepID=UPI00124CE116|nr:hypothetical protein [Brucella anthropi]KAB2793797.1 hypothetical protein F9K96_01080 [Brucella anthropi]
MFKKLLLTTAVMAFAATQGQAEDLPFDDSQHANVEGMLTSHTDRKIRKAGEVIEFAFNVSSLTRSIPAGDYVRVDYGATDIVRNDGSLDSYVDFGLTCPSMGSGVPVGGSFACTGSYTVRQADIDAGGFMIALGVALSTRDFALYGGTVLENFEVEEVTEPETPKPEDEEKTACKPAPMPANGAKFVFRYRTGSICS